MARLLVMGRILSTQNCVPAANVQLRIQTQITSARTRRSVTTCLYLGPIIRARSLSTLIAVDVNSDTPTKTEIEALKM